MEKFDCTVIGDVILDVFVEKARPQISRLRRGTSYCGSAKIDFGGAGNVASGLSVLGGNVLFIGKAGDDLWGKVYELDLATNNVTTNIFFAKGISTGLAFVTAEKEGERSFRVFRGANDELQAAEVNLSAKLLRRSEYLYFSGYSLVSNPQKEAILHAINIARRHGVKVVFDPGAHNLIKSDFELFKRLLDICDVFCPNLEEAKAITKTNRLETAIKKLQRKDKLTALKCGEDGCILIKEDELFKIKGFRVDRLDTTGAGDAFAAALIYGLLKNLPPRETGRLANWFAAYTVKSMGARTFASKREINSYLRRSVKHHTCA